MIRLLRYSLRVMVRPFHGFGELKYEGMRSTGAALILMLLAGIAYFVRMLYSGVAFSGFNPFDFNLLRALVNLALPFALFVVGNWAVSTVLDGEGSMPEIYCAVCYSLVPYILAIFLATGLTYIFTLEEAFIISAIETAGLLWSAFMIFAGLMTMHQYTPKQTVGVIIVTFIFMGLAIFAMILLSGIWDKLFGYLTSLISELKLRM